MSGLPNRRRSIFAPVVALSFSAQQEQECADYMLKRSASTELVPISDEAQLTLTADGRLSESGYRFNLLGFTAVCNAISGGLSRVIGEISGESPSRFMASGDYSVPSAVSIYNEAMRVRFESLRERNLMVDHQARIVDGFLGLNHKILDNSDFLGLIQNEMASNVPAARFYRGELVGRELRVYILDSSTRRAGDSDQMFAAGWYFCNREDTGNSVRALPCLYTKFGVALGAISRKQRIAHVGTDLVGRTGALVSRTFEQTIDMDSLKSRLFALKKFRLGFTDDTNEFETVCKKWTTYLIGHGIMKDIARHISKNAAMVGADLNPRDPLDVYTKKVLVERTGYDLICSILRHARNQPTYLREKLQAVAMELLLPTKKKKQLGDS
jgi:hypothetical protein